MLTPYSRKNFCGQDITIEIDYDRNSLLTDFGLATLQDRYLMPGEQAQDAFARVSCHYADDSAHASRLYDYMSKMWFTPSTPVLSNGGTEKNALPISCFLNEMPDNLRGIQQNLNESFWLAAMGGGIGTNVSSIRSIGEKVGLVGKTTGVIPFMVMLDSQVRCISQGNQRRGSLACYMDVSHPEIEEFIEVRRPTGGDPKRKCLELHNAVNISDEFMRAVEKDTDFELRSPHSKAVVKTIRARDIWVRLLISRIETGEPYLLFIDNVNKHIPSFHREQGLTVRMSNLCSEITLPTGIDLHGKMRTAVCCLSSVNLEYFSDWVKEPSFIEDLMRYLDNILQDFINSCPEDFATSRYSAIMERSVGLGAMGFHSFLQSKGIAFESVMAKVWNKKMFKFIKEGADAASKKLAIERGPCEDAKALNVMERFANKIAIAPNASSSIYCGNSSPGIEPYPSNSYNHKTLSGTFNVRNKHLKKLLAKHGKDDEETWTSITVNSGSVQHLDFLPMEDRDLFKTAFELDQRWLIEHAADRTPFICQAQSLNVFLPADVHKTDLHMLHYSAWKKGIKSLYYCRSKSLQRAEVVSENTTKQQASTQAAPAENKYAECIACS